MIGNEINLYSDFWENSFAAIKRYIISIDRRVKISFFPSSCEITNDCYIVNKKENIENSANKIKMNKIFEKEGIPHPKTYYKTSDRKHWYRMTISKFSNKKYISKPVFGCGGEGKVIHDSYPNINSDDTFIQEFFEHDTHLRVYYIDYKAVYWAELVGGTGLIRNVANGWKYKTVDPRKYLNLSQLFEIYLHCFNLMRATRLNFFAVDIAFNGKDYKFLEMNAMPAVYNNDDRIEAIGDFLIERYRESKSKILSY